VARRADAAHHVGFKKALPIFIGNRIERLRLEDPHVVHQDIDLGYRPGENVYAVCLGKVSGNAFNLRLWQPFKQALSGIIHGRLIAPIEDYARADVCESVRDREANAYGRTGNNSAFIGKVDFHQIAPACIQRSGLLADGALEVSARLEAETCRAASKI
jgi:hypothetical protein